MNQKELAEGLAKLSTAFDFEVDSLMLELYWDRLSYIPPDEWNRAVFEVIDTVEAKGRGKNLIAILRRIAGQIATRRREESLKLEKPSKPVDPKKITEFLKNLKMK